MIQILKCNSLEISQLMCDWEEVDHLMRLLGNSDC